MNSNLKVVMNNYFGNTVNRSNYIYMELLLDDVNKGIEKAIALLSDLFYSGIFVEQSFTLADFIKKKTEYPDSTLYSIPTIDEIYSKETESLLEERRILLQLRKNIKKEITVLKKKIVNQENDGHCYLDEDGLVDWRQIGKKNREIYSMIDMYEGIYNNPYHGRVDICIDIITKTFYIGNKYYEFPDICGLRIVSAAKKIAGIFNSSGKNDVVLNGHSGVVKLRKRILIDNGEIKYVQDITDDSKKPETVSDPFLKYILEIHRKERKTTDIIQSVQAKQNEIINADVNFNIIVQGCAGSGKTMIMLHRIASLLINQKINEQKTKIVIPSRRLETHIRSVITSLNIDNVERLTLGDLLMDIILKYRKNSGREDISEEESNQIYQNITNDRLEDDVEEILYSNDFITALSNAIKEDDEKHREECRINNKEYLNAYTSSGMAGRLAKTIIRVCRDNFNIKLTVSSGLKHICNSYTSVLYIKALSLFLHYGPLPKYYADQLICIDEGQNINQNIFKLLYSVYDNNTVFNIYGDIHQRVNNTGLKKWEQVESDAGIVYSELNENYRNSEQVIKFYNDKLRTNDISMGISTQDVKSCKMQDLVWMIKLQLFLNNRIAVIAKSVYVVPQRVIKAFENNENVMIGDVDEFKGLEFETVFVFDAYMSKNEKYVAYTRAINELYIMDT